MQIKAEEEHSKSYHKTCYDCASAWEKNIFYMYKKDTSHKNVSSTLIIN